MAVVRRRMPGGGGHLKAEVPLACWSVSRFDGVHQAYLWIDDDVYGLGPGHAQPWPVTMCRHVVDGAAPQLAPDAMAVPQYRAVAAATCLSVGTYAGVPIRDGAGELFGTLCEFDPDVHGDELLHHGPLLHILAALLRRLLHVERGRVEAVVAAEELR